MKRLVSFLLALIMVMSYATAMADDTFVMRNGVEFGDTMDEVRSKETLAWDEENCDEDTLWTVDGTVAGFDDVEVVYFFDESGKLTSIRWDVSYVDSSESSDVDYEKLYKAFVSKYGKPLDLGTGNIYIISGKAMSNCMTTIALYRYLLDGIGDVRDSAEWRIQYGNGDNAKLELVQYYSGISYSDMSYTVVVSYDYFSDADLETAQKEKQEENAAIMNDI